MILVISGPLHSLILKYDHTPPVN